MPCFIISLTLQLIVVKAQSRRHAAQSYYRKHGLVIEHFMRKRTKFPFYTIWRRAYNYIVKVGIGSIIMLPRQTWWRAAPTHICWRQKSYANSLIKMHPKTSIPKPHFRTFLFIYWANLLFMMQARDIDIIYYFSNTWLIENAKIAISYTAMPHILFIIS